MHEQTLLTPNYIKSTALIRSCLISSDVDLIKNNIHNSDWIIEFVAVYFLQRGFEMYINHNTIIKLFRRWYCYYFELHPIFNNIKERENWNSNQLSLALGYKNYNTFKNSVNIRHLRSWLRCYESLRGTDFSRSKAL